jgi:hypothetical protein
MTQISDDPHDQDKKRTVITPFLVRQRQRFVERSEILFEETHDQDNKER